MSDVENWRNMASALREVAKYTIDADARRVLLMLAADCEVMLANMTAFRGTLLSRDHPALEPQHIEGDKPHGTVEMAKAIAVARDEAHAIAEAAGANRGPSAPSS